MQDCILDSVSEGTFITNRILCETVNFYNELGNKINYYIMKYICVHCGFKDTIKCSMIQHKILIHVRIKYSYDQCDYKATLKSNLRKHQGSIHKQIQYSCEHCAYTMLLHTIVTGVDIKLLLKVSIQNISGKT